ncbi:MAG: hypothetical protein ACJA2S_000990, partial [Cyclobacteriaceae bacterium]
MRFKLIILLLIAFFSFKAYGQSEAYYKILIEIEGLQDSVAYLGYHMGEKKYVQDTSLISSNGVVSFSKPERLKKGVYFLYSNKGFYIEFLVKEQVFSFKTSKSDPYGDIKIKGSPENEIFLLFQLTMRDHQNKIR